MKKRNTILILGIVSIIILITVQVFLIRGVYNSKSDMFTLKYRLFSQDALNAMNRRFGTDGFDTARLMLNYYSGKAAPVFSTITDSVSLEAKQKDVILFVNKVLNQEQYLSEFLTEYFDRRHIDNNFSHKIKVNYFELINNEQRIPIYTSEEYSSRRPPQRDTTRTEDATRRFVPPRNVSEILVKSDRSETDYYRLDFDYFIDFTNKQKIVLRETAASLIMSILSIIIVMGLFIITYKNLREEKRLSNLKTDFINNMTHELKTPLSTITVAGKTLMLPQIRQNDEKVIETARMIGKQSVHLNQLINMILEISMWERTQFQITTKKVDIGEFMKDIVDSFKSGGGNGAVISQKYNFSNPEIEIDTIYFTTLINNLLSNAVKYCDKDPVIDVEGLEQDNSIQIKVSDNGIGIGKNDQKHVFDKFYRASTGNIHKYKGLGLGLYYVKKIAEAHGGDVSLSSKPGKGSIFTVTIPFK